MASVESEAADETVAWAVPGRHGSPAEALARIGALCRGHADLFSALFAVLATHQGVSRDLLAAALQQFRPELAGLARDDVVGLLTAILHGGRPGFEAVLRSRQRGERRASALPWVKD
jgi:hypothetical protein